MDYKPFKDETWINSENAFITTIESHGLDYLIDKTHVVANQVSIRSNVDGFTRIAKIPFKLLKVNQLFAT
jgi:hypothetical protein